MINTKGVKPAKFENGSDEQAWCHLACAYVIAGHSAPEKAADAMLAEFRTRAGRATEELTEDAPASEAPKPDAPPATTDVVP